MLKVVRSQFNKPQQALHQKPACEAKPVNEEARTQIIQYPNLIPENLDFKIKLADFKRLVNEFQTVINISSILEWDSAVILPERATDNRAGEMSCQAKLAHEILTSKEMGNLISYLKEETNFTRLDKHEQALLREMKNQYNRGKNIPGILLQELASTIVQAQEAWSRTATAKDFSVFIPSLEKIIFLKRKIAEYIKYEKSPYDALLEAYEPGMTAEKLDKLFEELKGELIPIVKKINSLPKKTDTTFLNKDYDTEKQMELGKSLLKHIQFDFSRGCLDEGNTSFSLGIGPNNVRLVSVIFKNNIFYTMSTLLHEGFHGLYDQGFDPALATTPLFDAPSTGMHEAMARLGEIFIGQGLPFCNFFLPKLKDTFPEQLQNISPEQYYKAINDVQPSYVWSESDEAACNLHICILFEIERNLIEGKLTAKEVHDFWSKKLEEYCGITPPNDEICSHWSSGDIGYFPAYTLGNLYAAQIYNTMKKEIPDLEEQIANGNIATSVEWLKEKIFKYGKTESPSEIMTRVTGEQLNPGYYLNYIKDKYSKIYGIEL